jgi:hypothetical protein
MPTSCKNKRMRSIVLFLEPTPDQEMRRAVMTIQCHLCGQLFEFVGIPEGEGVTLSADRRELRVAITEGRKWRVQ